MNIQALAIAVAATTGIVEVLKKTGLPSRWAPILSLVVGFGMTLLFTHSFSWETVAVGILTGLSASGVYSGVKSVSTPTS